jgi:hypothetical protein
MSQPPASAGDASPVTKIFLSVAMCTSWLGILNGAAYPFHRGFQTSGWQQELIHNLRNLHTGCFLAFGYRKARSLRRKDGRISHIPIKSERSIYPGFP